MPPQLSLPRAAHLVGSKVYKYERGRKRGADYKFRARGPLEEGRVLGGVLSITCVSSKQHPQGDVGTVGSAGRAAPMPPAWRGGRWHGREVGQVMSGSG